MTKEHKAVMKQEVADIFIENLFQHGTKLIDPFAGLGTTEISCNKFNIECTSIELIEEYTEMPKLRIEKEKDEQPQLRIAHLILLKSLTLRYRKTPLHYLYNTLSNFDIFPFVRHMPLYQPHSCKEVLTVQKLDT